MRVRSKKEHPSGQVEKRTPLCSHLGGDVEGYRSKKSTPLQTFMLFQVAAEDPSAAVLKVLSKKSTALEPYVGFCIPSCSRLLGFDEPSAAVSELLTEKSTSGAVFMKVRSKKNNPLRPFGG